MDNEKKVSLDEAQAQKVLAEAQKVVAEAQKVDEERRKVEAERREIEERLSSPWYKDALSFKSFVQMIGGVAGVTAALLYFFLGVYPKFREEAEKERAFAKEQQQNAREWIKTAQEAGKQLLDVYKYQTEIARENAKGLSEQVAQKTKDLEKTTAEKEQAANLARGEAKKVDDLISKRSQVEKELVKTTTDLTRTRGELDQAIVSARTAKQEAADFNAERQKLADENKTVRALLDLGFHIDYEGENRTASVNPLTGRVHILSQRQFEEAGPLLEKLNIVKLTIAMSSIQGLEPLRRLKSLTYLDLNNSKLIADVSSLKELVNLRELDLSETSIENIEALRDLGNLRRLNISSTKVEDLGPLQRHTKLEMLGISNTRMKNPMLLTRLSSLRQLSLRNTNFESFDFLRSLNKLEELDLDGSNFQDSSLLSNFERLVWLNLSGTKITSVTEFTGLRNLRTLGLRDTQVKDLSPLAKMANLDFLNVTRTPVSTKDIESLRQTIPTLKVQH